jgi:hypothetical protein
LGEEIVLTVSNNREKNDVGSAHPGGGEAAKGKEYSQALTG